MITKVFEVLDRATCMTVIATRLAADGIDITETAIPFVRELQLLQHVGLGSAESYQTLFTTIGSGYARSEIDPYGWEDSRTRITAHKYIDENWHKLTTGDIIDVEYILKEIDEPHKTGLDPMLRF